MDNLWFRCFGPPSESDDAVRLVCFPHAGGSASAYAPLARLLAPRIEVRAVQYPGRQDRRRETPAGDITELAGRIAERLRDPQGRPYALFGHSMGALLAYETARTLRSWGVPAPVRLFLSGRGAPSPVPPRSDVLPDDAAILNAVRSLGGTAAAALDDPELMEMALPALRADYRALAAYSWHPGDPLDVPVTVLTGRDDPVVTAADPARWAEHTRSGCEVRVFPGNHFYLDQQVAEVAEVLIGAVRPAAGR
ncbi:thioesterase II family protein [Streptomyces sp. NPDC088755]|uniref:thioesterase II family protein n=1 Tax=Streptomyces sp. NPDC088755 TaxID=3365888 RepID=UPI003803C649